MDGFSSLEELYNRVKPALKCKVKDLNRTNIYYIHESDVFNYLKNTLWIKKNNLTLGEIVNDIMLTSNAELEVYVQSIIAKEKRKVEDSVRKSEQPGERKA